MTVYMILFFLGFMLAIGLLAYTSMQMEKLNKKAGQFSKDLQERYSKPLKGFEDSEAEKEREKEEKDKEAAPADVAQAATPAAAAAAAPAAENKK
ncbi:MAG: hypothetical protein LBQ87_08785 [Candidatus Fibromonas sp.]|jgi:predicted lipid-binding transport protein (Tim44 family)|nr:hypothetical protein [Candidatus Fibromonas sp.]